MTRAANYVCLCAGSFGIWPYIHRVPLYYIAVSKYTHANKCVYGAGVRKTYIGGANGFASVFGAAVLLRRSVYILCVGYL